MKLVLEKFSKSFGPVSVIENLDLTVHSGEMLALLGPSGCGKSTTLFSICGIYRMNSGKLLFDQKDMSNVPSQQRNVGVVFQNYALYPHMTVYENIAFPLKLKKLDSKIIDQKVQEIANLVYIPELLKRKPAQLSGGQQQRVALARALIREPDVLLLDEPLANLDAKLRLEMRSEIKRIQKETGITAILVTHDQVEAMSMCDRIALMKDGKIIQLSTPDEMYKNPIDKFVAGFIGNPPISFLNGVFNNGMFIAGNLKINLNTGLNISENTEIVLGIRPEHFGPQYENTVSGKITFVETQGREDLYDVSFNNNITIRSIQPSENRVELNSDVNWGIMKEGLLLFDKNGKRLK